jgi:hypothetical protein
MMKFLYSGWFGLMAIAGLLSTGTAQGAIIYTLEAPIQSGGVGDILHFTGTVTNAVRNPFPRGSGIPSQVFGRAHSSSRSRLLSGLVLAVSGRVPGALLAGNSSTF